MAVMARETWTDERLDDLKGEMNGRFDQVDKRFDRVEAEIKETRDELKGEIKGLRVELKGEIKELSDEVKGEIKELRDDNKAMLHAMNQGFARIHSNMLIGGATIVAALIGSTAF
jgi:uncharacterized protein YPO0396